MDLRTSTQHGTATRAPLKLSEENSKIETEFEVDQNVVGDKWKVRLKHDGKTYFKKTRETKGPSGSFEVRQVVPNHGGTDRITARARNVRTDELCKGSAKF